MKVRNIKYAAHVVIDGITTNRCRLFCSEEAKNNWCNKEHGKHDWQNHDVTIEVYNFQNDKLIEIWHA